MMLMFQFLKELYLAEFTSFFKASSSSWTPGINAAKGAVGVAIIEGIILVAIDAWIEVLVGKRLLLPNLQRWEICIAFLILYISNYYVLVTLGHGLKFERNSSNIKRAKRISLMVLCRVTELATVAFFIYSIYVYHRFFHKGVGS
jgi:hypothetical protein